MACSSVSVCRGVRHQPDMRAGLTRLRAGDPIENRRFAPVWRECVHSRAVASDMTSLRVLVFLLMSSLPLAAQRAPDGRLTPADVERLSGATGVRLVPRGSQTGAGGDLNFVTAEGKLLLMVNFGDAQLYRKARDQKQITVGGQTYP